MSDPPPGRKIITPKSRINSPKALPTLFGAPGPAGSTTQFSFAGAPPPPVSTTQFTFTRPGLAAVPESHGGTNVTETPAVGSSSGGARATSARSIFATAGGGGGPTVRAGAAGLFGASPLLPARPAPMGGSPSPSLSPLSWSSSPFGSPLPEAPKSNLFWGAANPPKAAASGAPPPLVSPSETPPAHNPSFSPLYPAAQVPPGLAVGLFGAPASGAGVAEGYGPFGAAVYNPFAAASTTVAAVPASAAGHFNTPSPSATYNPFAAPTITTATGAVYSPFVAPTITAAPAPAPAPTPAPVPTPEPADISKLRLQRIKKYITPTAQPAPSPTPFDPPAANPFNTPSTPLNPPTYQPFIAPVPVPPNTTTTTPGMVSDFANLAAIMRELQKPLPPAKPAPPAFLAQTTTTDTTTPEGLPQDHGCFNAAATTSTTPASWPPGFGAVNAAPTGSGDNTLFGKAQSAVPASSAGSGSSSLFGQAVPTPVPALPASAPVAGVFSSVLPTVAAATTEFRFGKIPTLPQGDDMVSPTDTGVPSEPASLFQTATTNPTAAPETSATPLFPAAAPAHPPPHSTTTTTTTRAPASPLAPTSAAASTFPPFPPLPTYLTPTTSLSEVTTYWTSTLEAHMQTFTSHGALLRDCDIALLTAHGAINDLTLVTSSAEAQSATHDRALDRLAADQRRMEEVLDWYEAFVVAQERAPEPVDAEREGMLGGLLGASERVEEMVRGAEEMVGVLNEAGGRMRGVGGPLGAVVTILNDHLATLLWVDGQTAMLSKKVTEAKEAARSVPDLEEDAQFRPATWVPWAE